MLSTTQRSLFGTPELTQVIYAELDQTAPIIKTLQLIRCRFLFQSRTQFCLFGARTEDPQTIYLQ